MESSSDSDEEYFDAEDVSPTKSATRRSSKAPPANVEEEKVDSNLLSPLNLQDPASPEIQDSDKLEQNEKRKKKLLELRRRVEVEDEDADSSQSASENASVEGVTPGVGPPPPTPTHSHPFRVVDFDQHSVQSSFSLGKVGRVLGGVEAVASRPPLLQPQQTPTTHDPPYEPPRQQQPLQEPDVIASTKPVELQPPVRPPRRKRKGRQNSQEDTISISSSVSCCLSVSQFPTNMTPAFAAVPPSLPPPPPPQLRQEVVVPSHIAQSGRGSRLMKSPAKRYFKSTEMLQEGSAVNSRELEKCKSATLPPMSAAEADESYNMQLNLMVRTRTDSGKDLTDLEILEQVPVRNLDTGEMIPLSAAEEKLPQCINPLSAHIMNLTSKYTSDSSIDAHTHDSDQESVDIDVGFQKYPSGSISGSSDAASEPSTIKKRRPPNFKKILGKTWSKARSLKQEVFTHGGKLKEGDKDEGLEVPEVTTPADGTQFVKMKASHSHKGPYDWDTLQYVQDLSEHHTGPVWTMKYSPCGRLLATAGQDRCLRIWVLRQFYTYFLDMRNRYSADTKTSPTPSQESLGSHHSSEGIPSEGESNPSSPFVSKPFCVYTGHTADVLDVTWSKNCFILSSSMDKTVRLWHISRKECLCSFQHIDFVTAIAFHPKDDRYFLSGSLDGKLRLWNIPDKKVALWNELDGQPKLITAANFCQNGNIAVVGSHDGRCVLYTTKELKYHTQIHVRSTRGKNKGRKISGIEPMPGEDKILVTSNDSRIRLYDLRDLSLSCKYKGYTNVNSQIKATFSNDGKYIIAGSENQCVYIWKTYHDYSKLTSVRRDRNDYWEGIKAHNAVVTAAIFAPHPDMILKQVETARLKAENGKPPTEPNNEDLDSTHGYVITTADYEGTIKVFLSKTKPKHSSLPASAMM